MLLQKGEFIPPCVSVGEKVLLPEYGGTKINFDDKVSFTVLFSDRVHNSRQPLDNLRYVIALCDPMTLTFQSQTHTLVGYPKVIPYIPSFFNTLGSFIF